MTYTTDIVITFPSHFTIRLQALIRTFQKILENHDYKVVVDRGVKYTFAKMETIYPASNKIRTTNIDLIPFFPYPIKLKCLQTDANNYLYFDTSLHRSLTEKFTQCYKTRDTLIHLKDYNAIQLDKPITDKLLTMLNSYLDPILMVDIIHEDIHLSTIDETFYMTISKHTLRGETRFNQLNIETDLLRRTRDQLPAHNIIIPPGTQVVRTTLGQTTQHQQPRTTPGTVAGASSSSSHPASTRSDDINNIVNQLHQNQRKSNEHAPMLGLDEGMFAEKSGGGPFAGDGHDDTVIQNEDGEPIEEVDETITNNTIGGAAGLVSQNTNENTPFKEPGFSTSTPAAKTTTTA